MTVQNAGNGPMLIMPSKQPSSGLEATAARARWAAMCKLAPHAQSTVLMIDAFFWGVEMWRATYMDEPKGGEFWDKKR